MANGGIFVAPAKKKVNVLNCWLQYLILPKLTKYVFMKFLLAFVGLWLVLSLPAQPNPQTIDQYIDQARTAWQVPGLAVAIIKDGNVVLSKGYGVKSVGGVDNVDEHTLFAIASNTKAFISTSIALLVEEGKLKWDDPVQRYLPYFQLYDPYVTSHTTVRDLLCHRVGLGTFSGDVIWFKSLYSAEESVKRARYLPQAYEFRAGYGYSNLMFMAAGEVIKAVSGQSWDKFVHQRILVPLGMSRTQTSISTLATAGNFATPHKSIFGPAEPIAYANWDNMGAAGGLLSSVHDMTHWLQLHLNQGSWNGFSIYKPEAQEIFWSLHNSFNVNPATRNVYPGRNFAGYALGWSISETNGKRVLSHSGGYDGMYSQVLLVPDLNLGLVVLTNSMTSIGSMLCNYISAQYLGLPERNWSQIGLENERKGQAERRRWVEERQKARVLGTRPLLPLAQLAGTFYDPLYGEVLIDVKGSDLELRFPHAPALNATLTHWHHQTFLINWQEPHAWFDFGTIQFILDNNNQQVKALEFDVPNEDIFFEEIHAKRVDKK